MLSNLFRINFPYGIAKTEENKWYFINREYLPLGIANYHFKGKDVFLIENAVKYQGLTTEKVLKIVAKYNPEMKAAKTSMHGKIITVFFYDDGTNPCNKKNFTNYFKILAALSMFKRLDY